MKAYKGFNKDMTCRGFIVAWKSFVIDGKKYKPDTWYKLENGEVVEAED